MKLQDSVALVTGANRGLGLAFTQALVAAGAKNEEPSAMPALFTRRVTSLSFFASASTSAALVTSSFTACTPACLIDAGSRAAA